MSILVCIMTRLQAGRSEVRNPVDTRESFSSPNRPDRPWDRSSLLLYNGYIGSFMRVMRPESDVDHSPPSCVEVKNEWSYTSIPSIRLQGVYRENFTFYV